MVAATVYAVHCIIVRVDAVRAREGVDDLGRRAGPVLPHHARANLIEFGGRHPRPNVLLHGLDHAADDTACRAQALEFLGRIDGHSGLRPVKLYDADSRADYLLLAGSPTSLL